jgi:hypothetical protein
MVKQNREWSMIKVNQHTLLFVRLCAHHPIFLKKLDIAEGDCMFSGTEAPNLVHPLSYSQSLGSTETVTCYDMHLRIDLIQG